MTKFLTGLLAIIALQNASALTGSEGTGGVGNPASIFCVSKSGKHEVVTENAGQFSLCRIGTAAIEEWTLLYSVKDQTIAAQVFMQHPTPTPVGLCDAQHLAECYCREVGGALKVVNDLEQKEVKLCRFSDNSIIETTTLFLGPDHESNLILVEILTN